MNPEKLIELAQARLDGKEVQEIRGDDGRIWKSWDGFIYPGFKYRIKPEPLECWAVYDPTSPHKDKWAYAWTDKATAEKHCTGRSIAVHMREVE